MVTLPVVTRTEIDGIPAFWSEVPGPFTAALVFRVGHADGTLIRHGITHLIEHLATSAIGQPDYACNAFVEDSRTVFHASGSHQEVLGYLGTVLETLRALPAARLEKERAILRSERDRQVPGVGDALRIVRYGAEGYGLRGQPELALDWLAIEEVQAWADEWFTSGSAAIWLSGPPPAELRLDLPAGPLRPAPEPAPLPDLRLPAQLTGESGGVAVELVAERSAGFNIGVLLAERRLRQRLRFDEGLIYDIASDYGPLNGAVAEALLVTECRDEQAGTIRDAIMASLEDLATTGPTPEELAFDLDQFDRQFSDAEAALFFLDLAATDHLQGAPVRTPEEIRAGRAESTPESVARAMAAAVANAVIAVPEGVPLHPRCHQAPSWSTHRVTGREFKPPGLNLLGRGPKMRLILGDEGITLDLDEGRLITIRASDLLAVEHPFEAERRVWGRDGSHLVFVAGEWRDGTEAVAMLDERTPADRIICAEHGLGRRPAAG